MKILFITTHNLATNPRLYKEIILAKNTGYHVEIICFEFNNWSKVNNDLLIKELGNIKIIKIDAGRTLFFSWGWSVFTEKICRLLSYSFYIKDKLLSQALSRRSNLLIRELNKVAKPDWVVGHNLGAMWPTLVAAKKFNCKAGFDVEDYHPGEGNDKKLQTLTKQLIMQLLPKFKYVSFAAPLILKQIKLDVGYTKPEWFTVLNYFPKVEFKEPLSLPEGPIKLVWFSQNINAGRGLKLVLSVVKKYINQVELHLIGNLNEEFYTNNLKNISNVIIHTPLHQLALHQILAEFDIGLALDVPVDKNRDLVITNKLLAYLQAGLFIIATNTSAQKEVLTDWEHHGVCFDYTYNNFQIILDQVIDKITAIRKEKDNRFHNFKNNNWETASMSLLNYWNT